MLQPADIAWKFYVSFKNRNRIFAGWRRRIDVRGAKESQQEATKKSYKAKASQKRRSCSLILLRKTMRAWIALMGVPCDLVHLWISIKGKIYINQKYFYAKNIISIESIRTHRWNNHTINNVKVTDVTCNWQLPSTEKTIKSRIYVISDIWRIHEKCAHIKNTQIQKHQQRQQHDQQSWIREANKEKYNSCAG